MKFSKVGRVDLLSKSSVFKALCYFIAPFLIVFSLNVSANEAAAVPLDIQWLVEQQNDPNIKIIDVPGKEKFVKKHNKGVVTFQ
ncbi:MAG: hypothetical protein OQK46_09780 [Gammaproteobacteria bacterium]|nr:hypothetical protein [Gammaproteobacteria bacterium]